LPHIRPSRLDAAALTAQWQADETLDVLPSSMSSNAPLRADAGAASPGATEADVVDVRPAKPCASNS
jgi:hypothetical protein